MACPPRYGASQIRICLAVLWVAAFSLGADEGSLLNGFSLDGLRVPRELLIAGGPKRDGIKSVDAPEFATLEQVDWVAPENPVLGVDLGGEAHAYPVHLMEYHQVVNDLLAGVPVALTYDPIAGSSFAYRRTVDGKTLTFGVSGLLYNANFVMYDRETESLWSQFEGRAIAGPLAGKRLERIPVRQSIQPDGQAQRTAPHN